MQPNKSPWLLTCLKAWTSVALLTAGLPASAVLDVDPPVIHCPAEVVTIDAIGTRCNAQVHFTVTAEDADGSATVVCQPPSGSLFPLGLTTVVCTATDEAGNTATCEFVVKVIKNGWLLGSCPENLTVPADITGLGARVEFPTPTVTDACFNAQVTCTPASGSYFPVGQTPVSCVARFPWGDQEVCRFVVTVDGPNNLVWPRALEIPLTENLGVLTGFKEQALGGTDESRWFKFNVQPGARVVVTLTSLPANYDLVLFKDIAAAYQELTQPSDLSLLDAEFADDAFAPAQFSPAQFSPAQFSPAAFSPAAFSPAQFSPAQFSPAQFSPAQFSPAQFSPDAYAPAQFSPAQFSPAQFSPEEFSPAQFSPAQFSPAQFSEAAYASAQTRSVIAVSAFDGTSGEGVVVNTWNESTEFYIRVRGRQGVFDPNDTFRVDAFLFPGLCHDIEPLPKASDGSLLPPSNTGAPAGGYRTLLLVDYDRLVGPDPSAARDAVAAKLAELAARPEVAGYILDVGLDSWVRFFNAQADAMPECPFAKNLVAEAIRSMVDRSRPGNALAYLVLIGGDDVIPFFRHPDEAMLGPEQDFVPPVFDNSSSQASLRRNYFLSQDRYGARCEVSRKNTVLPLPELAVGRLVETPAEIAGMVDAYLETPGGVLPTPSTALVTGYDFLEDAANAVATELHAGIGSPAERLITPADLAPTDPDAWSADDLRAVILPRRHDIMFLAAHFSASALLAADFTTRFNAPELLDSSVDFKNAFLFSPGCHSGYNIVDHHAVPVFTQQPDWAQMCARKQMILLAGTGYQYGDTDFVEYSERLYVEFTRELRKGSGPVAIGQALVRAKQHYLASTADLRGIHEKSLLQATLFGLPMASLNMPGSRLSLDEEDSIVTSTQGYSSVPPTAGQVLNLRFADVSIHASLQQHQIELKNAERGPNDPPTITATWFSGANGVVSNPAEPILPLETRNVDVPGLHLRGIGFRGGEYVDLRDVTPLTGAATTEIRGVHPAFLSDEFFPQKFWRANYFGDLCALANGGTRLMLTPAQVRSYPVQNIGVIRRYPKTQLRLFYSANIQTYTDIATGFTSTPALSGPPSISKVSASTENNAVEFEMQVIGNPAAGIQEVWVLYTAVSGPWVGKWIPLDLAQDRVDSRLWKGSLPLGATPAADVRFVVQAVNGVGLVSFAANLGAYYIPDRTEPPPNPPATTVQLLSPPGSGVYGSPVSLRARLTQGNTALAGRPVLFKIGGLQSVALTDGDGIAATEMNLLLEPGARELSATFTGNADFGPSSDAAAFVIERASTVVHLDPEHAVVAPDAATTVIARLETTDGTPLPEQTVLFVVTGPNGTHVATLITDFRGAARLGSVPLPVGTYAVSAHFAQAVNPPPPFNAIETSSVRYHGSSDLGSLTLSAAVPTANPDTINGRAGEPLKIAIADLLSNDTDPEGAALTLSRFDATTGRGVPLTRSGAFLLLPRLSEASNADAFEYTAMDPQGNVASARAVIRILPDNAQTSNFLGLSIHDGMVHIRFAGIPGRRYRIEFTPSVASPQWFTLGSVVVGPDGTANFTAPDVGIAGFYRTVNP
ncbi:MAG: HYR domain-containing protein [Verrucomicrobiales bacterium]|nr:HYR domain-containing protein [Verrucomicrobiales bacterium]